MSNLSVALTDRLSKLIPRLASEYDSEVIATVRAIQAALRAGGRDVHDLAATVRGREIVAVVKAAQIKQAPNWNNLSHQERSAWMTAVTAHSETTEFERQRLADMANRLRIGMIFTPHWRYLRLFDELVARLHAKGVRA